MQILIFGNQDYKPDSLPYKLLPHLKKKFPEIDFVITDPNELGIPKEKKLYILDTVKGLKKIKILSLDNIKKLSKNRLSMHDFDLGMHLFWVSKLKKNLDIKIIGIPIDISFNTALEGVIKILIEIPNSLQENEQRS